MCIIADPPTFTPMFKSTDPEHGVFSPVREWVINGPGKFVMGGSTYQRELLAVKSIIPLLGELEKKRKVIRWSEVAVDGDEKTVKEIEPAKNFDDPHLVSLVRLTGCRLICIRDPRAHRYLRSAKFYRALKGRPRLYTRVKNSALLCTKHIAPCCK